MSNSLEVDSIIADLQFEFDFDIGTSKQDNGIALFDGQFVGEELSRQQFWALVFGDISPDRHMSVNAFDVQKNKMMERFVASLIEAEDVVEDINSKGLDAFYSTGSCGEIEGGIKQGQIGRTTASTIDKKSLCLDLDVGGGGGDGKYPSQHAAAKALLEVINSGLIMMPSVVVNSGGGLHAYWCCESPVIASEWNLMANKFAELLDGHLVTDKSVTTDLARLLRVPQTFNHKEGGKKSVTAIQTGSEYSLEQLNKMVGEKGEHRALGGVGPELFEHADNDDLSGGLYPKNTLDDVCYLTGLTNPDCEYSEWMNLCNAMIYELKKLGSSEADIYEHLLKFSKGELWGDGALCEKFIEGKTPSYLSGFIDNHDDSRSWTLASLRVAAEKVAASKGVEFVLPSVALATTVIATQVPSAGSILMMPDFTELSSGAKKYLATTANLEALMGYYRITAKFDIIAKRVLVNNVKSLKGEEENSLTANMKSLCAQHHLPKGVVDDQLRFIINNNACNPVTDWLSNISRSKRHDPINELASCINTVDRSWLEVVLRRWLIQCVAAADGATRTSNKEAIAKFESVLVFVGRQGCHKTSFLRAILPKELQEYFQDGVLLDLKDKDSIVSALSAWITELGELDSTFRSSDIAAIKAFLSKVVDKIRRPYARGESVMPRTTSFLGSVNEPQFLRDLTGNRRYLPVQVGARIIIPDSFDFIDLWAFVWAEYISGEQWWLTDGEEAMQKKMLSDFISLPFGEQLLDMFDFNSSVRNERFKAIDILVMLNATNNKGNQMSLSKTLQHLGIEKQHDRAYLMPKRRV